MEPFAVTRNLCRLVHLNLPAGDLANLFAAVAMATYPADFTRLCAAYVAPLRAGAAPSREREDHTGHRAADVLAQGAANPHAPRAMAAHVRGLLAELRRLDHVRVLREIEFAAAAAAGRSVRRGCGLRCGPQSSARTRAGHRPLPRRAPRAAAAGGAVTAPLDRVALAVAANLLRLAQLHFDRVDERDLDIALEHLAMAAAGGDGAAFGDACARVLVRNLLPDDVRGDARLVHLRDLIANLHLAARDGQRSMLRVASGSLLKLLAHDALRACEREKHAANIVDAAIIGRAGGRVTRASQDTQARSHAAAERRCEERTAEAVAQVAAVLAELEAPC